MDFVNVMFWICPNDYIAFTGENKYIYGNVVFLQYIIYHQSVKFVKIMGRVIIMRKKIHCQT